MSGGARVWLQASIDADGFLTRYIRLEGVPAWLGEYAKMPLELTLSFKRKWRKDIAMLASESTVGNKLMYVVRPYLLQFESADNISAEMFEALVYMCKKMDNRVSLDDVCQLQTSSQVEAWKQLVAKSVGPFTSPEDVARPPPVPAPEAPAPSEAAPANDDGTASLADTVAQANASLMAPGGLPIGSRKKGPRTYWGDGVFVAPSMSVATSRDKGPPSLTSSKWTNWTNVRKSV